MKKKFLSFFFLLFFSAFLNAQTVERFGNIPLEDLKMTVYSPDSAASAVVLFDKTECYFMWNSTINNFEQILERHVRIKILKQDGLVNANVGIQYDDESNIIVGLKARVYNLASNDKIEEVKVDNDAFFDEDFGSFRLQKIVFPNVTVGSIFEYSYKLTNRALYNIPDWEYQQNIPIRYAVIDMKIPEFFIYNITSKGYIYTLKKQSSTVGEKYVITYTTSVLGMGQTETHNLELNSKSQRFIYEMVNSPALSKEPYVTSMRDYAARLEFELTKVQFPSGQVINYTNTWEQISNKLMEHESFGKQIKCPDAAIDELKTLIQPNQSNLEKVQIVYNYLKTRVTWNNINSVFPTTNLKQALKDGGGNCADINLLLIAILRELNIPSHPVLLSTRYHGAVNQNIPTLSSFNYVIAYVKIDEVEYLLDATEKNLPFGTLPERCINGEGRVLKQNFTDVVNLSQNQTNLRLMQLNLNFDENFNLVGTFTSKLQNASALEFRNSISNVSDTISFFNEYFNDYAGLKVKNFAVKDLRDLEKPVVLNLAVEIDGQVERIENMIMFSPLLFFAIEDNPFKLEVREFPVDFTFPFEKMEVISYTIPAGYVIESMPENQTFTLPENTGKFAFTISVVGNSIQVVSKLQILKPVFDQTEYEALKLFYNLVVKKQAEQIILKQAK